MKIKNITIHQILTLEKLKLNLSHLFIIEGFYLNKIIDLPDHPLFTFLRRKGYITHDSITEAGRKLYELISDNNYNEESSTIKKELKKIKVPLIKTDFETWWKTYPVSDCWGSFTMTRVLRMKKEECEKKYNELLFNGQSSDDLLLALQFEIFSKKKASKTILGQNKLTYMVNSLTWFNQGSYLDYIKIAKDTHWKPQELVLEDQKNELIEQNKTIDTETLF